MRDQFCQRAGSFHAGRSSADDGKSQQSAAFDLVHFTAGLLEHLQQMIACVNRAFDILELKSILLDGAHSKEVGLSAHCKD